MKQEKYIRAYRIDETADVLRISRSSIYNMIRDGRLKSVKIAGRTLITCSEIERLLSGVSNDA